MPDLKALGKLVQENQRFNPSDQLESIPGKKLI
jgi:hypothetical protein